MSIGSVLAVLEAIRRDLRRSEAADRLLTWPERGVRALVMAVGFGGAALLWSARSSFEYPWLVAAAAAWLIVWCAGFAALVVFQRNQARRRARAARDIRRVAKRGRPSP